MSHITKNAVGDTTATTGTGTYTLDGTAPTGMQSFPSALSDSDTCTYVCTDGTDVEIGLGTYTASGTTLARTTIYYSTNGGSAVSWSSGSKDLRMTVTADRHCDSVDGIGIGSLSNTYMPIYTSASGTVVDSAIKDAGSYYAVEAHSFSVDNGYGFVLRDAAGTGTAGEINSDGSDHMYFNTYGSGQNFYWNVNSVRTFSVEGSSVIVDANADLFAGNSVMIGSESQNPKTIASWTSGTAHQYCNLYEAANGAYLVAQGASGGHLALVDLGGSADDKFAMWFTDAGRVCLNSYTDAGSARESNIITADMGTGNVGIGGTNSGTSKLWIQGGRLQLDNNETITLLTAASATAFNLYADTSDDIIYDAQGTGIHKFEDTVMFDNITATPSGTTQTIQLEDGNTQKLDLSSSSGDVTLTFAIGDLKAACFAAGQLKVVQHGTTARDITWAVSGGTSPTIKWLGTEPTWNGDATGATRIVSWNWDGDDEELCLAATESD